MIFSSIIFLFLFLPLTILIYFVLPRKLKNTFLFLASLVFYAWGEGFFVFVMLASVVFNYLFGLVIGWKQKRKLSKFFLIIAVTLNLCLLCVYKYANFFVDNINSFLTIFNINPIVIAPVHLPIGISFFTFQAMSYVIDIYRSDVLPQRNPVNIGLYIASFPQLIAGPIIRYHDVEKQLISRSITLNDFATGVERFIFGLGKKILIANQLAVVADQIFSLQTDELTIYVAWLGAICYTFQIYFDFSGYSDMAIGLGRMFGFYFLENFNYPYISKSIREFWKRWHISLSNWFRDYLYIALGGNRRGAYRTYLNLLIVFFLCGLWHGASWNFVVWGMLHGFFMVIERIGFIKILNKLYQPLQHVYTLLIIILCWVIFRAEDLSYAMKYVAAMFGYFKGQAVENHVFLYLTPTVQLALCAGTLCSLPILSYIKTEERIVLGEMSNGKSMAMNIFYNSIFVLSLLLILFSAITFMAVGAYNPFIYFRF